MPSVQVGLLCYADLVSAGEAACAAQTPVSSVIAGASGPVVVSLSCGGVTPEGKLKMTQSTSDGSVVTTVVHEIQPAYSDCQLGGYIAALELVLSASLIAWVAWYGIKKINDQVRWGRGNET